MPVVIDGRTQRQADLANDLGPHMKRRVRIFPLLERKSWPDFCIAAHLGHCRTSVQSIGSVSEKRLLRQAVCYNEADHRVNLITWSAVALAVLLMCIASEIPPTALAPGVWTFAGNSQELGVGKRDLSPLFHHELGVPQLRWCDCRKRAYFAVRIGSIRQSIDCVWNSRRHLRGGVQTSNSLSWLLAREPGPRHKNKWRRKAGGVISTPTWPGRGFRF